MNGKLIDRSGTTTANQSKKVADRTDRRYFFFQNLSDTDMWLNFGAAATAAKGSIQVKTGASPLFFEGEFTPTDQVNVFCTAAKDFTCKEG